MPGCGTSLDSASFTGKDAISASCSVNCFVKVAGVCSTTENEATENGRRKILGKPGNNSHDGGGAARGSRENDHREFAVILRGHKSDRSETGRNGNRSMRRRKLRTSGSAHDANLGRHLQLSRELV